MSAPRRRVVWMGYGGVQYFTADIPYIVISIASPGAAWAPLMSDHNRIAVQRLAFNDIREPMEPIWMKTHGAVLYTETMAHRVIRFVEEHAVAPLVVCHCEAGVSRSAGMAAALAEYFGRSSRRMFRDAAPNPLVYGRTLYAARYHHRHDRARDSLVIIPNGGTG